MRQRSQAASPTVLMTKRRGSRNGYIERLGARIQPQPNGCWYWDGNPNNYGTLYTFGNKHHQAHRLTYEILVGPIPDGHHIHHLCETPGCVNPKHLIAITPAEHNRIHHGSDHPSVTNPVG